MSDKTDLRLHLGCGKRYIPGFVHIDLADFPHIDYRHDIATLPMMRDNTAELIYCCHAFEYYDRQEAIAVFQEWRRALKPGGVLRLAVPDFEALIQVYRQTGDLSKILGPLYGRMPIQGTEKTIYHRTVYDFASLKQLLESAGFANVHRYDWRDTVHKDHDDFSQAYFPHLDKTNGILISLNVEATKTQ